MMRNTVKRTLAIIVCLTMMLPLQLAAAPTALAAAPEWTAVGGPGFSADSVWYTSLAIASDGTSYVAYEDYGNAWKATVMRYNGAGWEAVGSPGFSAVRWSIHSWLLTMSERPTSLIKMALTAIRPR